MTKKPFALSLCENVGKRDVTGSITWRADPAVLYPAVIARIREALTQSAPPEELLYPADSPVLHGRRPYEMADAWVKEAQYVRSSAWDDALIPRSALPALPLPLDVTTLTKLGVRMFRDVKKRGEGKIDPAYLPEAWQGIAANLTPEQWDVIERLAWRAFALDFALGWFHEALRVVSPTRRTFGSVTRDPDFALV